MLPAKPTNFESAWRACLKGKAMYPARTLEYDPTSTLIYSPLKYEASAPLMPTEMPTDAWIRTALHQFVRGEFGSEDRRETPPYPPEASFIDGITTRSIPHRYLERCEAEYVYGPYLTSVLERTKGDLVQQLYALIVDPLIGNRANARNVTLADWRQMIEPELQSANRLRFVLPAFPFKDQNPFRTQAPASCIDMGEIGLIVRMHVLALAFYQVHAHGADFLLISDGRTYAPTFGVSVEESEAYLEGLIHWRSELNLDATIHIVDLADLVDRCNGTTCALGADPFTDVQRRIRGVLDSNQTDTEFVGVLAVLRRGMRWNLDMRRYLKSIDAAQLWAVARGSGGENVSRAASLVAEELDVRAAQAALEYASFNLTMKYLSLLSAFLPRTVRATIHPKPGQVAVPSMGSVFPWNGIAMFDEQASTAKSLSVTALIDAVRHHGTLQRFSLTPGGAPFYYSIPTAGPRGDH